MNDSAIEAAVNAIRKAAQTGRIGDGKIFVSDGRGRRPHPDGRDRDPTRSRVATSGPAEALSQTANDQGPTMKTAVLKCSKAIKDNDIKYVDLRFTDPRGKWQHVTLRSVAMVDEEHVFRRDDVRWLVDRRLEGDQRIGHGADARSDDGHDGSVLRRTDAVRSSATFSNRPPMRTVRAVDPRGIAKKAEAFAASARHRRFAVYFGPEAEFFVFDDVRFRTDPYNTGFILDSSAEFPSQFGHRRTKRGNLGHRVRTKGGYFPVPPQDSAQDMRGEMLAAMAERWAANVEKHHHEVASAQHELGLKFGPLTSRWPIICRSTNIAIHHGRAELWQDRDLHAEADLRRQRLGDACTPVDLEGRETSCSPATNMPTSARNACGTSAASSSHAKSLNAITNPSTNSYKRLVPGYEAPVLLSLFRAQPLGVLPDSVHDEPQGQAPGSPVPRSDGEPLPCLHGDADGRARRHSESEDRSRPADGQGPLRSAAEAELKPRSRRSAVRSAKRCSRRSKADRMPILTAGGVFGMPISSIATSS